MEFVKGRSLKEALSSGKFAMDKGARIVALLCRAMNTAHKEGIIHRDLKPQNIMLDEADDPANPVPRSSTSASRRRSTRRRCSS